MASETAPTETNSSFHMGYPLIGYPPAAKTVSVFPQKLPVQSAAQGARFTPPVHADDQMVQFAASVAVQYYITGLCAIDTVPSI